MANSEQKKARLKRINAQQKAATARNKAARLASSNTGSEQIPEATMPPDTSPPDLSPDTFDVQQDNSIPPSIMRTLGRKVGAQLNSARYVAGRAGAVVSKTGVAGQTAARVVSGVASGAANKFRRSPQKSSASSQSPDNASPPAPQPSSADSTSTPPQESSASSQSPDNASPPAPQPSPPSNMPEEQRRLYAEQADRLAKQRKKQEEEDEKARKSEKSKDNLEKVEKLVFWIALLFHIFDVFLNRFDRGVGLAGLFLSVYIFLGAVAAMIFSAKNEGSFKYFALKHTIVAIAATGAPILIILFRNMIERSRIFSIGFLGGFDPVTILLSIISVFPIFILGVFTFGPSVMGKFWKILFTVSIFLLLWSVSVGAATDLPDVSGPMLNPIEGIIWYGETVFVRPVETFWRAIKTAPNALDKGIRRIYEPYFYGTVEDNKKDVQLGVYLKNLQPLVDTVLIEDREIIMFADVQAKTFTGDLLLKNYCYAEFRGKDLLDRKTYTVRGNVDLNELRIFDFEENTLTCRINRQQIQTKDRMIKVYFNSTFNFHTWGFIDYTFMERNELMNRRRSGRNVARELGISQTLNAVYTNGPLTLGMARATDPPQMPYGLNADDPILPLFGVTLENAPAYRTRGAIQRIRKITFHVPPPITLDISSCTPQIPMQSSVDRDTGYTLYTATNVPVRSDSNYQTIRCRMNLPKDKLYDFLGEGGVAIATFAVEVEYDYEISAHRAVNLEMPIETPR